MKNILKEISNPYSIENFKILLNLYLDSGYMTAEGRQEFYQKVVSYNQNRDMNEKDINESVVIPEDGLAESPISSESMYNSHWLETNYFSKPRRCKT